MSKRTHGVRWTLGAPQGVTWCGRDVDSHGLLFADAPTCRLCAPQKSAATTQKPEAQVEAAVRVLGSTLEAK